MFRSLFASPKRRLDSLSEQEVLALAISSEEDDARIYLSYADRLKTQYPESARVFTDMAEVEHTHRNMLIELHRTRFGERILREQRAGEGAGPADQEIGADHVAGTGAAEGAGVGDRFLGHIERCRVLIHLIDITGTEDADPAEAMRIVEEELAAYGEGLEDKARLVVLNKLDLADAELVEAYRGELLEAGADKVFAVSGATGAGIPELLDAVLGYLPGMAASVLLYRSAAHATRLPLHLTTDRAVTVFLLTLAMCALSGFLALRKVLPRITTPSLTDFEIGKRHGLAVTVDAKRYFMRSTARWTASMLSQASARSWVWPRRPTAPGPQGARPPPAPSPPRAHRQVPGPAGPTPPAHPSRWGFHPPGHSRPAPVRPPPTLGPPGTRRRCPHKR